MGQKLHFFFQENIGVGTQNICLEKTYPLLSWNFSNLTTWRGDMGQKLHFLYQYL